MKKEMRLDKTLSNMGYGSRSEIKLLVKRGFVMVNNEIVKDPSVHIDAVNDDIIIDGEKLNYKEFIYIMLNKPAGVISATYDKKLKTVIDILPDEYKCFDIFPIGRLDIDTEGLLVITNDGQLAHDLLAPKKHVPKKYYAKIEGNVTDDDIEKFKAGVKLDDGYITMPADLTILKNDDVSEIELIIHEGKFHQVKRMFEAVEKKVVFLKRTEMGKLKLDKSMKTGDFRELADNEIDMLKNTN